MKMALRLLGSLESHGSTGIGLSSHGQFRVASGRIRMIVCGGLGGGGGGGGLKVSSSSYSNRHSTRASRCYEARTEEELEEEIEADAGSGGGAGSESGGLGRHSVLEIMSKV
jgi:hypothetical protein